LGTFYPINCLVFNRNWWVMNNYFFLEPML
jgi:hypothetical protein